MIFEHEQTPYGLFAQGDMYEITENYKASNLGKFKQAELNDLNTLNNKDASHVLMVTKEGKEIPIEKAELSFGRCAVGENNKSITRFKNNLKITPIKIDKFVFDTKEQITTKFPASSVKPGEYVDIEFDWRPSAGRRKALHCSSLMMFEPVWSKRMEQAIYPDDYFGN